MRRLAITGVLFYLLVLGRHSVTVLSKTTSEEWGVRPSSSWKRNIDTTGSTAVVLNVRGGGGGGVMNDKKLLVALNTASCVVLGSVFAMAPHVASDMYNAPTDKHTLDNISVSGTGALVLNWAITTYLATHDVCSVEEAVAFGHLPLLVLVLKDWLTGEYEKADVGTALLYSVGTVDALLVGSILYGFGDANLAAKTVSVFLGIQGLVAWAAPVRAGNLLIGRDLTGNDKSQAWFMTLGINRVATSLLSGALAWGVEPYKAVAYGTLAFIVMTAETAFVRKGFDAMAGNWPAHHKFLLLQLSSVVFKILGDTA